MDVKVTGIKSLTKAFDNVIKELDFDGLKKSTELIVEGIKNNIYNQSYYGEAWKGWSASSIGHKRRNGSIISSGSPLLLDTGRLVNSIKGITTHKEIIVKTDVSYAVFQDKVRRFMGITPSQIDVLITYQIQKNIDKQWSKK